MVSKRIRAKKEKVQDEIRVEDTTVGLEDMAFTVPEIKKKEPDFVLRTFFDRTYKCIHIYLEGHCPECSDKARQ